MGLYALDKRCPLILLGLEPKSLGYSAHSVDTVLTELSQLYLHILYGMVSVCLCLWETILPCIHLY